MAAAIDAGGAVRATRGQRARTAMLRVAAAIACRLPEPVIAAAATVGGAAWYRLAPARTRQARRNLERVVTHLASTGRGGDRIRTAAATPQGLDRLVRLAYRHAVRYYIDMMRVSAGPRLLPTRFTVETPEAVERLLATRGSLALVGMHFGALELPTLYLASRGMKDITVPMEVLGDPALQAWLVETRSKAGVRIVGLREARSEMGGALARGEIIGLVGDRDLSGGGVPIPLFGTPARLPVGPALMALESEIPIFVGAVRRVPGGRWMGRLLEVPLATEGNRRARLTGTMTAIAGAFETLIADAPEQWWTLFFPIWDDLSDGGPGRAGRARGRTVPGSAPRAASEGGPGSAPEGGA